MPTEPMPTDPTTPEPMPPESTTAAATTKNRKEPAYLFSEEAGCGKKRTRPAFSGQPHASERKCPQSRQPPRQTLLHPGSQHLPRRRSAREIQRIDGAGCLRLFALRRLHLLPRHSVLSSGRDTRRADGRTLGKRLVGIRVVSLVHERITFWQSMERRLGIRRLHVGRRLRLRPVLH